LVLKTGELVVVDAEVKLFTTSSAAKDFYFAEFTLEQCIPVVVTIESVVSQVVLTERKQ